MQNSLFGVCFFNHTHRPEKGTAKGKKELPEEIFSADLTVPLRGKTGYLDYFELSKEKLHREAVKLIKTELAAFFEGMTAKGCTMANFETKGPWQFNEHR